MDRRWFLKLLGVTGLGSTTFARQAPLQSKQNTSSPSDVAVVGAGVFGAWTAWHLQRLGAKVTLVDTLGPGNPASSSGGQSRLIQIDTDRRVYVRSGLNAFQWWKEIEASSNKKLLYPVGRLSMAHDTSVLERDQRRQASLREFGVDNMELLAPEEIKYRWPQIAVDDLEYAVYFSGGVTGSAILAQQACQAIAEDFVHNGGQLRVANAAPLISGDHVSSLKLSDGSSLGADRYVFACGAWLPAMFPDVLGSRFDIQPRVVLFFGLPQDSAAFSYPNLPQWNMRTLEWYGFPSIAGSNLKISSSRDVTGTQIVRRATEFLGNRFPALDHSAHQLSLACRVTTSGDSNFVVAAHPRLSNVDLLTGGSGHGFKHGPTVGEIAAKRALRMPIDGEYVSAWALKD